MKTAKFLSLHARIGLFVVEIIEMASNSDNVNDYFVVSLPPRSMKELARALSLHPEHNDDEMYCSTEVN